MVKDLRQNAVAVLLKTGDGRNLYSRLRSFEIIRGTEKDGPPFPIPSWREHAEHPLVRSGSHRASRLFTGNQPHRSFWIRRAMSVRIFFDAAWVPSRSMEFTWALDQWNRCCQYDNRSVAVQQYRISLSNLPLIRPRGPSILITCSSQCGNPGLDLKSLCFCC
jgi:hypothetical protein